MATTAPGSDTGVQIRLILPMKSINVIFFEMENIAVVFFGIILPITAN